MLARFGCATVAGVMGQHCQSTDSDAQLPVIASVSRATQCYMRDSICQQSYPMLYACVLLPILHRPQWAQP
jgi:hypothetical protein